MAGKPIHFDPDLIDISNEPEYQQRIDTPGPVMTQKSIVRWAPDGKASLAKRAEMLEIDREMFDEWIKAMEKLLQRELTDAEFTTERMMRLKLWTRERKRRQHNLHYKYDPTRRNKRLVDRDSQKQLEQLRRRLEQQQAAFYTARPDMAPEGWTPPEPRPDVKAPRAAATLKPVRPLRTPTPSLPPLIPEHLNAGHIAMIATDTGIPDPARADDQTILNAYADKGQDGYIANYYLALLRGRPLPERPEELG